MGAEGCEGQSDRSSAFPTTHWSAVLAAGHGTAGAADTALASLCETYWFPVYAFARRKGFQPADAQDLTQLFFTHVIKSGLVRKADPQRGRFRSFLLGCFNRFRVCDHEIAAARKWAAIQLVEPADLDRFEQRLAADLSGATNPEQVFDRHWAVAVLDAALARLRDEMQAAGRSELFRELVPCLQGDGDVPAYAVLGERLQTTAGTVKVTVHRLRRRYRELVREAVLQTLNNPMDVDSELAHLMAALRG